MRKLILQRRKTIIACLAKVRVFIEDSQGDFLLDGINCRQIGTLKNGQSCECEIPDDSIKVFVVFSKVAPQKYHRYYQIEPGSETVQLYTKSRFAPSLGNPFEISDTQI